MSRAATAAILAALAAAMAAPLWPARPAHAPVLAAVPWPALYEGRPLRRIAPGPGDAALAGDFPGSVARFADGRRQIVLRRIAAATRRLHPARDCFHALGNAITPAPRRLARDGTPWSCVDATRDGRTLRVCEQIRDAAGRSFPDVSSWYWPALLGTSPGPWLAAMTVERLR